MTQADHYDSPRAVEAAIASAAKAASAEDLSLPPHDRIRQEYFRRFLTRVFIEGDRSEWVLKGGTSMLARVPSARATTDIDLFHRHHSLDAAVEALRRAAETDLRTWWI